MTLELLLCTEQCRPSPRPTRRWPLADADEAADGRQPLTVTAVGRDDALSPADEPSNDAAEAPLGTDEEPSKPVAGEERVQRGAEEEGDGAGGFNAAAAMDYELAPQVERDDEHQPLVAGSASEDVDGVQRPVSSSLVRSLTVCSGVPNGAEAVTTEAVTRTLSRSSGGAWTDAEHVLFLSALKAHGDNEKSEEAWTAIAKEVGTRGKQEVEIHAQAHFFDAQPRVGLARGTRAALECCAEEYNKLVESTGADSAVAVLVDPKVCGDALAELCQKRSARPGVFAPLEERLVWTFHVACLLAMVLVLAMIDDRNEIVQQRVGSTAENMYRILIVASIGMGAAVVGLGLQPAERFPRVFGSIALTPSIAKKVAAGECLYHLKDPNAEEPETQAKEGSEAVSELSAADDPRWTLHDFLVAGLRRCVPFTTGLWPVTFDPATLKMVCTRSFDWSAMLVHFAVLASAADHGGKVERQQIADLLGADDFDVWPADVEDIEWAIGIPEHTTSIDFLVLLVALALDVDDEPSMQNMIKRFAYKASQQEMVARHIVRVCDHSCEAHGVNSVQQSEAATAGAIETLSGLGAWIIGSSTRTRTSTRNAAIQSYLEEAPVGRAAVVDTVLQLYYENVNGRNPLLNDKPEQKEQKKPSRQSERMVRSPASRQLGGTLRL